MLSGTKLIQVRQARGMTQAELARRAGLTQQAISAYERENRGRKISYETLRNLARILDVQLEELLEVENQEVRY